MNIVKRHWFLGLFCFLVVLGVGLRVYKYWEFPLSGETADEFFWTFQGASLLQTGIPSGWSHMKAYKDSETVVWSGIEFRLVTPLLDHPPLFSLAPGSMVTLMGQTWRQLPSLKLIRAPLIFIGIVNLLLFAWWLWHFQVSKIWKIVSLFLFSTVPSWVFLSRLVVSENMIMTWLLLLAVTLQSKGKWRSWAIFLLHALLPLTKMIGVPLAIASILILFTEKKWKRFYKKALLGLVFGFSCWLLYAAIYDIGLWWQLQFLQTQRGTGLANLFNSFLWRPVLINKVFYDPWTLMGHVATGIWLLQERYTKNSRWQRWWGLLYMVNWGFLLVSVGENVTHGWYQIVIFPMLALGLGAMADWIWKKYSWRGLALTGMLLALPVRTGLYYLLGKQLFLIQAGLQRLWLVGVGLLVLCGVLRAQKKKVFGFVGLLLIIATLFSHISTITNIDQWKYWMDDVSFREHLIPPY